VGNPSLRRARFCHIVPYERRSQLLAPPLSRTAAASPLPFAVLTKARKPAVDVYMVKSAAENQARGRAFWKPGLAIQAGVLVPSPSMINCPTCPYQGAGGVWRRPWHGRQPPCQYNVNMLPARATVLAAFRRGQ